MFANRLHVSGHEFTNAKKLVKKLARTEQVLFVANCLPTCLPTVFVPFTHTNLSLPTYVCRVKAVILHSQDFRDVPRRKEHRFYLIVTDLKQRLNWSSPHKGKKLRGLNISDT